MIEKAKNKKIVLQFLTAIMICCLACGGIFIVNASLSGKEKAAVDKSNLAYYMEGSEEASASYGEWETITDGTKGLIANFGIASDKLVLRQVVNLYELNMKPIITIRPAPVNHGTADYTRVRMDLVDVHNPEHKVSYRTQCHPGNLNNETTSYTMAKSHLGLYKGFNEDLGEWCSDAYGESGNFPFYDGNLGCISYHYDPVENRAYVSSKWKLYVSNTLDGTPKYIADLDDSSIQGANVFDGFTTGEVYVEIWVEDFQGADAHLMIEQYGDYDLSNTSLIDNDGPQINVDLNGYDKAQLPNAVVGCKYPVYKATAFDVYSGNADVGVKVYYNYYSNNKAEISVRKDGTFIPTMAGSYSIVYSSYDNRGNKSEQVYNLYAVNAASVDGLAVELSSAIDTVAVGEAFVLPELNVTGYIGNYSDVTIDIEAVNAGKELTVKNGEIRPTLLGDLTVKITVTDFVGQKVVKNLKLNVTAADKATFIEAPALPKYFVEGLSYKLPELNAYNYVDGTGDAISTTVRAVYGTTELSVVDGKLKPVVNNHKDKVDVIYDATINGKTSSLVISVPVYKVKSGTTLDMSKYFEAKAGTVTANDAMTLAMANGTGEFEFINSLYQTAFVLDFTANEKTNDIDEITAVLTDYYDAEVQISFTYKKQGDKVVFFANGDKTKALTVASTFAAGQKFQLTYDDVTKQISFDYTKASTVGVEKDLNGKAFNGFTGNEYYVTFYMKGTADGSVALNAINGSTLNSDPRDYVGPRMSFVGDYGGEYEKGSEYVLPKAIISDVLDGKIDVELTVEAPDGSILTSVQGKKLESYKYSVDEDISVVLNDFGVYFVTYYAVDSYNNRLNFSSYTLSVIDDVKPVIKLTSKLPTEVTVGTKVYIPTAEVTDDKDNALGCTVLIVLPTGRVEEFKWTNATGFVTGETGCYNVIYSARDSEGNISNLIYTIKVVEG